MHAFSDARASFRLVAAAMLAGLALLLGGCVTAAPSDATAMTAAPPTLAAKHDKSVTVSVKGGSETSAMGVSKISSENFAAAIKSSIEKSGLFARLADAGTADYRLEVMIVRLDQPTFGLTFTVNLEAGWRLIRRVDDKVVWQKAVTSSFTATTSDSMMGVTRLRLANEGAARANIQDALAQISALTLE